MSELPSFLAIFTAAFFSYAFIGHMLFGPHIEEWVSLMSSLETCGDMMRWTGWRFDRLRVPLEGNQVAVAVAAVYYYSYVILMQFMHFNILTAILISGYQSLSINMKQASPSAPLPCYTPHLTMFAAR